MMPLQTVKLAPGVNTEVTDTQGMAQITLSQLIRFKFAGGEILPEKLGGWEKFYVVSIGSAVRALHAWEDLNARTWLAVGAEETLAVINDGVGYDITPQTEVTNDTPAFTTTMGDNEVTIDDVNFTPSFFDSIYLLTPVSIGGIVLKGAYAIESVVDSDTFTILAADDATASAGPGGAVPEFTTTSGSPFVNVGLDDHPYVVGGIFAIPESAATTVGGLTLSGAYLVQAVVDADNFTIVAQSAASSNDSEFMNAGDAQIMYFVSLGPPPLGVGYGLGAYGDGAYGLGVAPGSDPGTPITTTNWSLGNWGEVLIATPFNGSIYTWSPDSGFPLATRIVEAPLINGGAFVSQPAQILVAWAASQDGVQDPLLVSWSDAGDYSNWTVSSQTQAGSYRLPTGSRIVGGTAGPSADLIWTDVDLWAMDYISPPLIFGFNVLGTNCGLIGIHAYAMLNSVVYWMTPGQFCSLSGERVTTVPCSVWDFVFQDLDTDNAHKICGASNSLFNEVAFYFPSLSGGTGEIDSYVKFNPVLNTWDCGRLQRTAWIDQSQVGEPVGGDASGYIYQHEVSPDNDGQPMVSWFETGLFALADGEQLTFVDWVFPDFKWGYYEGSDGAVINITLRFADYPNADIKERGPYSVSSTLNYVNTRLRGRFAGMKIGSEDLGSFWRLGAVKIRGAADGKR